LRPYLAKSWRADRSGLCSTELIVMRPRPAVDDHWLGYLVQTDLLVQWATATSEGVKMPRTSWEKLRLLEIDLPSLDTQRAIAAYLDAETARIDAVVNVRRRTSLLVEEHRKARISYFVSTGRPVRVKHAISLCTSGPRGWGDLAGDSGSPFIRSANLSRSSIEINNGGLMFVEPPLSDEADRSRVACGDVLAGITGANTGWIGLVRPEHAGGFVSQHVAILRPDGVEPEWLAYSLVSDRAQQALLSRQYGGTKTQLGLEDLRELEINVPARGKQLALVAELRNVEETVLATQAKIGRQIDLLLERRQALITAAVTGQLQMPGSPPD
jgi:type I restriction enzyme S subunit